MNKKVLYDLLNKANENAKKTLNKENQKMYRDAICEVLKEEGLTEEIIYYIISGTKFKSMYSFASWCSELQKEEQLKSYESLIKSRAFIGMDNALKLRFSLTLIAKFLSEKNVNQLIVCDLFHSIVEYSLKKDGKRLSDISKIFQSNFMDELKYGTKLPTISEYHFTVEYNTVLLEMLTQAIEGISPKGDEEIARRNQIREWLKENAMTGEEPPQSNDLMNAKTGGLVIEDDPSKNQITQEEKKAVLKGTLAKKIMEFATRVDVYEQNSQSMANELKGKDKEIAKCKTQVVKMEQLYKLSCNENTELRSKLDQAMTLISELQTQEKELQDKVSRQSSVIDIIDEDKGRSLIEFKNQIASALKKTYDEFIVAQTMNMTVDLGLNVRDSLEDVFKKLKKQGIDIEGR